MTRGTVVIAWTLTSVHMSHTSSNRAPDCRPKHNGETDASKCGHRPAILIRSPNESLFPWRSTATMKGGINWLM